VRNGEVIRIGNESQGRIGGAPKNVADANDA
jgi:hypothetical protein